MSLDRKVINEIEYAKLLDAQEVPKMDYAVKCCMCGTVQSARDFLNLGIAPSEIGKYLGFSCIGRFMGAGSPRATPDSKPCNWTLGGLFKTHKLEVELRDGKRMPVFEPATKKEAQALMQENYVKSDLVITVDYEKA